MTAARRRVSPGDGERLSDVLAKMGDVARTAAEEGRAFVNGQRSAGDAPVSPGDDVEVHAPRATSSETVVVLAEEGGFVVAEKPADLPTEPDRRGHLSLVTELAVLLGIEARTIHAVSRLDVGVSGAVLCALGEAAQGHAARARAAGTIRRAYAGIASGTIVGEGVWDAPVGSARDARGHDKPRIGGKGSKQAQTRYAALAAAKSATLFQAWPKTGRMHQIRLHAAHAKAPLFGDREHGGPKSLVVSTGRVVPVRRIALHAFSVRIALPDGSVLAATSPVPEALRSVWSDLGGRDEDWETLRAE